MSKLTKLYLGLGVAFSIAGILINMGVIDTGDVSAWYMTLPLGAVFIGLFVIWLLLDKESARYDAENAGRH